MYSLVVNSIPVSWKAHKGFGKKAYNPRHGEKLETQWILKNQWKEDLLDKKIRILFLFYLPIPKSASKKRRKLLLESAWHDQVPDATNLQKFMEDTLKGTVIKDDKKVVAISSEKRWADVGKTIIKITEEE